MQESNPTPPSADEVAIANGSSVDMPPPPGGEVAGALDPKMTVMGGGEKEKASDFANCKI